MSALQGRTRQRQRNPVRVQQKRTLRDELIAIAAAVNKYTTLDIQTQTAIKHILKHLGPTRLTNAAVRRNAEALIHRLRGQLASVAPAGVEPTGPVGAELLAAHQDVPLITSTLKKSRPRRPALPRIIEDVPRARSANTGDDEGPRRVRQKTHAEGHGFQDDQLLRPHNLALALVLAVERTGDLAEAMRSLGIERSRRWGQRIIKKHREGQVLYDLRRVRQNPPTVLTESVERDILSVFNEFPAATISEVVRELERRASALDGEVALGSSPRGRAPSESTVRRYLASLPATIRDARGGNLSKYHKLSRLVGAADPGLFPNDVWEQDSSQVPRYLRVRELIDGEWKVRGHQVYVSKVVDTYSRAIVGYAIQLGAPSAELTIAALANAMLRGADPATPFYGQPREIRVDRGTEFKIRLEELTARLGIVLTVSPPASPNTRPFVERGFDSLWNMMSILHGYAPAERGIEQRDERRAGSYPTIEEFLSDFLRVVQAHNRRTHSGTGEAPILRWSRHDEITPVDADAAYLLLERDPRLRTVGKGGVERDGVFYTDPALQDHVGRSVILHVSEQHAEKVEVLDAVSHVRLCTARVRMAVSETIHTATDAYKRELRARTRDYVPRNSANAAKDAPIESQSGENVTDSEPEAERTPRTATARERARSEVREQLRAKALRPTSARDAGGE